MVSITVGVRVHPPGTGIMHTLNLEQLATVMEVVERDGTRRAAPDTLIGTDSHTPMINGIGVLAWGVGGLEAESVFFGLPVTIRLPDVVGVRLTGPLGPGVLSTDLALEVTHLLRKHGISGEFIEFFGEGVPALTCGDRAVVANMAPEYGASTGFFPIDGQTIAYLRQTGRNANRCAFVERAAKALHLWFDRAAEPRYSRVIDLDLSAIEPILAGPRRPQDRLPVATAAEALEAASGKPFETGKTIPDGAIAIAAITSCTNTSDQRLLAAAGLVARSEGPPSPPISDRPSRRPQPTRHGRRSMPPAPHDFPGMPHRPISAARPSPPRGRQAGSAPTKPIRCSFSATT